MATKKKAAKKIAKKPASRPKAKPREAARKAPARRAPAAKRKPGAMNLASVSPSFTVNDVEKSIAFYRDILGFVVKERWEEGGRLLGAELATGDVSLMIGQDDWKKGRDRQKGIGFRLYCPTAQPVDAIAAGIKARGGTLDQEPMSEAWGRHFGVTDPDGFKITIVNLAKKS